MASSRILRAAAVLAMAWLCSTALAEPTQVQYLSGVDKDNTVPWDFFCTAGQNSGTWTSIAVPSCWELQGFGTYAYGKDDTNQPVEQGKYRHQFTVPGDWSAKRVFLVFEGSMTDTEVMVNGQSAGPKHQGSFYRFRYDVSKLLKYGAENLLEATVSKLSSDESVNRAERQSDYWLFGGIYRPVYLEAFPQEFIDRVAINAKADGSFAMDVYAQGVAQADRIEAQIKTLDGKAVGEVMKADLKAGQEQAKLSGKFDGVQTWTAETPNLYQVQVQLKRGDVVAHEMTRRFGFRTIDVRPGDGIYVNGVRVLLKGCCRHSFWPDSGRTLSRKLSEMDVALMKEMNMNAVRMSHYPPDQHFLDVCDEQGLYVLDELGGWQKAYGTEVGKKLVAEMVPRDVNHPSILFWDNGNEGGWNTALDGEFGKYDPQKRNVLHPWGPFGDVNTKHYPTYAQLQKLLEGPMLVMPTEFLHGLFDGGAGAGLWDYWEAIRNSKVGAGGFIWAFLDEGVKRTDRNGEIDVVGNRAPDGILGPYRQKEGSFYTIKRLWSPAVIEPSQPLDGTFTVENRYNFTLLDRCKIQWELRQFRKPGDASAGFIIGEHGEAKLPPTAPGQKGQIKLDLPADWKSADALAVEVFDPNGKELWTWVFPTFDGKKLTAELVKATGPAASAQEDAESFTLQGGDTTVRISKASGELVSVNRGGQSFSFINGPRLAAGEAKVAKVEQRQDGVDSVVQVTYSGNMRSVTWRMMPGGWLKLDCEYELAGDFPFMGVNFDYPEAKLKKMKWLGVGPYRVWKNRMQGGTVGVWENAYNDTLTGEKSWIYPEFRGYFANVRWVRFATDEGPITAVIDTDNLFVRVLTHPTEKLAMKAVAPFPAGDISFLHAIPAIGNKFQAAKDVGPQSQLNQANGVYRAAVYFRFGS
jgi:beta-galactosidase/beta-glucuronidase